MSDAVDTILEVTDRVEHVRGAADVAGVRVKLVHSGITKWLNFPAGVWFQGIDTQAVHAAMADLGVDIDDLGREEWDALRRRWSHRGSEDYDLIEKRIPNSVPREHVEIGELYDPTRNDRTDGPSGPPSPVTPSPLQPCQRDVATVDIHPRLQSWAFSLTFCNMDSQLSNSAN